ncbi:MAG: HupE/UreJ family protein [Kordiimonadaceae bacterium]|nr:HupE/UreJ family protein [Kordiimonadaceae bacterium]MBO6568622.1 HupE/UreJ family protein [Kordiimonadaceae bacterium]MBO6965402.1 HupE/UreJ family protein [Kordiimonadaceae bacterium]
MRPVLYVLCLAASLFVTLTTWAHEANDARMEVEISGQKVHLNWGVSLADLDVLMDLDNDRDGNISRSDIDASRLKIESAMLSKLRISSGEQSCTMGPSNLSLDTSGALPYLYLDTEGRCEWAIKRLSISYDFLFDLDYSHQAIVQVRKGENVSSQVASQGDRNLEFRLGQSTDLLATLKTFFVSGLLHIVEGYDHIAFLLVLTFSVLVFANKEGSPFRTKTWQIALLLTGFTIAHAISIILAQLDLLRVPSQLVESFIALSIVIAAIDVWKPFMGKIKWYAVFVFGLIHGLGFASSLGSVGLDGSGFIVALFGFNFGIELGQVAIAAAIVALDQRLQHYSKPRHYLTMGCVTISGVIGLYWFVVRAFGF